MSSLNKLKKNAINQRYKNMTPEQVQNAINIALEQQKKDLYKLFNEKLEKLEEQHNNQVKSYSDCVMDTIIVELLYEIANQMNYWELNTKIEEDKHTKKAIKKRIQEIYSNTMESIQSYLTMKSNEKARNKFQRKKKKIEKEFKIKF